MRWSFRYNVGKSVMDLRTLKPMAIAWVLAAFYRNSLKSRYKLLRRRRRIYLKFFSRKVMRTMTKFYIKVANIEAVKNIYASAIGNSMEERKRGKWTLIRFGERLCSLREILEDMLRLWLSTAFNIIFDGFC